MSLAWLAGQRAALASAPVGAALALVTWAIAVRFGRGRAWRWAALLVLAASALRTARAARRFEADEAQLRRAVHGLVRCEAEAEVTGSPKRRGESFVFAARLSALACDGGVRPPPTSARLAADVAFARGDRLSVTVQLGALEHFDDPSLPDPVALLAPRGVVASGSVVRGEIVREGRGVLAAIDRLRNAVRERIETTYPTGVRALARALVLGEEDLAPDDQEAFQRSGLAHLLAVSGSHLVVAVLSFTAVLRAIVARIPPIAARWDAAGVAAGPGAALAFAYAELAGGSGSAWRAAWMLGVLLAARAWGVRPRAERALGLSIGAMSAANAFAAFDLSFLLSTAATMGLLVGAGPVAARLPALWGLGRALAASVSATLATAPILALSGASLSLVGLGVNLVAAPLGELFALPFCLLSAAARGAPLVERGAALVGGGALSGVAFLARVSAAPSWAAVAVPPPTVPQIVAVLAAVASGLLARRLRLPAALGAFAVVVGEIAAVREGRPTGRLRVTFFDVGQGDAALVDLPDGTAMLVDGGGIVGSPIDPGKRVLLPELAARRRRSLELAVLSHPHPDHFLGLATVAAAVPVRELWDTGQGEERPAAAWSDLVARVGKVVRPEGFCGTHERGGARIVALAPCPGFDASHGANDNSIVLRVTFGRRAVLLVGDAERQEEASLVGHGEGLRADVLKLGHHGSRTSSSEPFLRAVAPSFAVASTGVRNRFGHPHRETVDTLRALGIPWARTDAHGAVTWETDGESVRVRTRRP